MLSVADLKAISSARLVDAQILLDAQRYDSCVYICGYAVECALKARIATTLNWAGFPEKPAEFAPFRSFKTHDLDILLSLTGIEQQIRGNHLSDWSEVKRWNPESRYNMVGTTEAEIARTMVDASTRLLAALWKS